jgi:preprotein translocase subunit YajC
MYTALLAEDPAPVQPQPAGGPQGSPFSNPMFLMIGVFMLFWIIVILPMSRRKKKEEEKLLSSVTRGTKILTASGIVATVVTIKDGEDEVVIRSEDTKLRIKRHAIQQVLGTDAAEAAKG